MLRMDDTTTLEPLRKERDYEAALERLEELAGNGACESEDALAEEDALQSLVDDFETRQGIPQPPDDDDFELHRRLPDPETLHLAVFHLSNGNELRLLGTPDTGDLSVIEIADAGAEDLLFDERWAPNAIFRRLAPSDHPVPRMLLRLDRIGAFAGRRVVDAVAEPIEFDLSSLGVQPLQAVGAGSCQLGGAGAAFFKNQHCHTSGGPGYGPSESYCYENSYSWIQKTSSKRRRTTYTRMAACGSGSSLVRHFYRRASGWRLQRSWPIEPHKVVSHWSARSGVGSWRFRRVRFDAVQPGAWVRGWVRFHTQVAGGWF